MTTTKRERILKKMAFENFKVKSYTTNYELKESIELNVRFVFTNGKTPQFSKVWERIRKIAEEEECYLVPMLPKDHYGQAVVSFLSKERLKDWITKLSSLIDSYSDHYWFIQGNSQIAYYVHRLKILLRDVAVYDDRIVSCQSDPSPHSENLSLYGELDDLKQEYTNLTDNLKGIDVFTIVDIADQLLHAQAYVSAYDI